MIQKNTESHPNLYVAENQQLSRPVLDLSPRDQQTIAEALVNPPSPNEALKKAARDYQQTVHHS